MRLNRSTRHLGIAQKSVWDGRARIACDNVGFGIMYI